MAFKDPHCTDKETTALPCAAHHTLPRDRAPPQRGTLVSLQPRASQVGFVVVQEAAWTGSLSVENGG